MKKRYYDYDTLCGAMHDVVLKNGALHRCIDAGMIVELHQADVVERKKGKWIKRERLYQCSACEGFFVVPTPFCPNCGADLREEKDNEQEIH